MNKREVKRSRTSKAIYYLVLENIILIGLSDSI